MKILRFLIPAALVAVAVVLFLIPANTVKLECARPGAVSSGFYDDAQQCNVTEVSYAAWADREAQPKITRLAGLGVGVLAVGSAVVLPFVGRRRPEVAGVRA